MRNRFKPNEDDAFATWGANNWETIVKMFTDYQSEYPQDNKPIESFALFLYEFDQSLVDDWDIIQQRKETERLLQLN